MTTSYRVEVLLNRKWVRIDGIGSSLWIYVNTRHIRLNFSDRYRFMAAYTMPINTATLTYLSLKKNETPMSNRQLNVRVCTIATPANCRPMAIRTRVMLVKTCSFAALGYDILTERRKRTSSLDHLIPPKRLVKYFAGDCRELRFRAKKANEG